jgi:hypothetical protein
MLGLKHLKQGMLLLVLLYNFLLAMGMILLALFR